MKTRTGHSTIDWSALEAESQERMSKLFEVAERKALFSWTPVRQADAEVVMLDRHSQAWVSPTSHVVVVGDGEPAIAGMPKVAFRLGRDFTLGQLIEVFDRLALVLMDRKSREIRDIAPDSLYGLKRWVGLAGPLASPGNTRALALMSKKPLPIESIARLSGLNEQDVRRLLRELNRLQVLDERPRTAGTEQAPPASRAQTPQKGLVGRLSTWLSGRRATSNS